MCETTGRAELLLPMLEASAGAARRFARATSCAAHCGQDVLDDASLLISELVTNAVCHGSPPILLTIECVGGGLNVRVRDGGSAVPQRGYASSSDEGGRGLALVDELSHTWGVDPVDDEHGIGQAVWFELLLPG